MPRINKPKEKQMTHYMRCRLTEGEYNKLLDWAEGAGMNVSQFMRHAIQNDVINLTYTMQATFPDVTQAIKEISKNMSAIGNNLNQISRWMNGGGNLSEKGLEYIHKAQQDIGAMRRQLAELDDKVNSEFKTFTEEN